MAVDQPERGAGMANKIRKLKRPAYRVGEQVQTALGVGTVKRVFPGSLCSKTTYCVMFVRKRSGVILHEDQMARLRQNALGRGRS